MSTIKVTPQSLIYNYQKFTSAASELSCINNEVAHLVSNLDWEVRIKGNIENMICRTAAEGKNLVCGMESMSQYLKNAANLFQEADANGKTAIEETICKMPTITSTSLGVTAETNFFAGLFLLNSGLSITRTAWLKKIIGFGSIKNSVLSRIDDTDLASNAKEPDIANEIIDLRKVKISLSDKFNSAADNESDVIVDTFNGVPAKYEKANMTVLPNGKPDYSAAGDAYQCSGYIKKYYKAVYNIDSDGNKVTDVTINDLLPKGSIFNNVVHDGIPNYQYTIAATGEKVSGQMLQVKTPQPGDIISVGDGKHWAIVKALEGSNIIAIEQNVQNNPPNWGVTINQRYDISSNKFYRIP